MWTDCSSLKWACPIQVVLPILHILSLVQLDLVLREKWERLGQRVPAPVRYPHTVTVPQLGDCILLELVALGAWVAMQPLPTAHEIPHHSPILPQTVTTIIINSNPNYIWYNLTHTLAK